MQSHSSTFLIHAGIESRLEHFEYLGVEAIWLSPVYRSPMVDFGYDVSDFTDIDPVFGNMRDFEDLIAAAQRKGIQTCAHALFSVGVCWDVMEKEPAVQGAWGSSPGLSPFHTNTRCTLQFSPQIKDKITQ